MKRSLFTFTLSIVIFFLQAQSISPDSDIQEFILAHAEDWELLNEDVADLTITDDYISKHNGVRHIFLQQTIDGIPIYNAGINLHITREGEVKTIDHRLLSNIKARIENTSFNISPEKSIQLSQRYLDVNGLGTITYESTGRSGEHIFRGEHMEHDIKVSPVYLLMEEKLKLTWNLNLEDPESADYWEVFIDVNSGKLVSKYNATIYCTHGEHSYARINADEDIKNSISTTTAPFINTHLSENPAYLVFPLPLDSPSEGPQQLVLKPHFEEASPYGWHDINGNTGPEYTTTAGNNVLAFTDRDNNNISDGDNPEGGNDLQFIFPVDLSQDFESNKDAAVTNLFYTCNMVHDLVYLMGFDEPAGNYQSKNYKGEGGRGGDPVQAHAFDGIGVIDPDTGQPTKNNANFLPTGDGVDGRMQMYLFDKIQSLIQIESPEGLSDRVYKTGGSEFGAAINTVNINAEIVLAFTGNEEAKTQGCEEIVNNVQGKIAIIDRGLCDFSQKVYQAQQAGAIMAIVCNVEGVNGGSGEETTIMAAGDNADNVNIPSVFMKKSDCDLIRLAIENGDKVIMSAKDRPVNGPDLLDASLDNGVIIHEYAHGISTRLTGGPSRSSCLPVFYEDDDNIADKGEQMGEGWSDFFALALTTKVGDFGEMSRGIGTYVSDQTPDQKGFRVFPYSRDMDINPLTYDNIKTLSVPHGVGTVWCAMLWDLYWNFIDLYGFDPDWRNKESGNFKAMQLVMDGMKLQPCGPGFIDGRDAILEADRINYGGIHELMIWETFARRGLGYHAEQGSGNEQRDGQEDFTIPPLLVKELKIERHVNKIIDPGAEMDILVKITNHIPTIQTNVKLKDQLPEGLSFVTGSANVDVEFENGEWVFDLGAMEYLAEQEVTFRVRADENIIPEQYFYDDIENGNGWTLVNIRGDANWIISNIDPLIGQNSWYLKETFSESDQRLISPIIFIEGNRPVLRFWHKYNIANSTNGAFVEISIDNGASWQKVDDKMIIRNQYEEELSFSSFAIPNLQGFSGTTNGKWVDSFIDLDGYQGEELLVRFRYGSNGVRVANGDNPGWFIDGLELLDLEYYISQACVSSEEDPEERCSSNAFTVVNTNSTTLADDFDDNPYFDVYPNPAKEVIYISSDKLDQGNNVITVYRMDGTISFQGKSSGNTVMPINIQNWTPGMYLVQFFSGDRIYSRKFVVK